MPSKSAKPMQAKTETPPPASIEERLPVALRLDNTYEYHLELPRSAVESLIDPDVDDCFIEVPCAIHRMTRYLHTSHIKEIVAKGL